MSCEAWGIALGNRIAQDMSAESPIQPAMLMNRAFSAGFLEPLIPGALPQAEIEARLWRFKQR
jgi:hypothetical protein